MSEQASSATSALQRTLEQGAKRAQKTRAPAPSPISYNDVFWAMLILVLVAIAFGGGGVRYGMANLIVQLTALSILAIYRNTFFTFWSKAPIAVTFLVGATLALSMDSRAAKE